MIRFQLKFVFIILLFEKLYEIGIKIKLLMIPMIRFFKKKIDFMGKQNLF